MSTWARVQIYCLHDLCKREWGSGSPSHEGPFRQIAIPGFGPSLGLGHCLLVRLGSLTDTAFGLGLYAGGFTAVLRGARIQIVRPSAVQVADADNWVQGAADWLDWCGCVSGPR